MTIALVWEKSKYDLKWNSTCRRASIVKTCTTSGSAAKYKLYIIKPPKIINNIGSLSHAKRMAVDLLKRKNEK